MKLMGEEGIRFINEYAVQWSVAEKLADPAADGVRLRPRWLERS